MSTLVKGLLLGGAVLLAYNAIARKVAAGSLNFLPGHIKGLRFDGVTPIVTVGVLVQNTSNQSFNINSLACDVFTVTNGKKYNIGNASFFQPQLISPNTQATIWIDLRLSLLGVVSDLLQTITSGNFGQDVTIEGTANVDGLQYPINLKYNL